MKLAVIIPTRGRPAILQDTVHLLASQTRVPDEIVVSAPDASHVGRIEHHALCVSYVFGSEGTSAQRNRALDKVVDVFDIVTFFDDDFLPAADYIETLERLFGQHPEWTVLTGRVVLDGASSAGYSFEEGRAALATVDAAPGSAKASTLEQTGGYGCNMSMRAADIGQHRFDERLPLYGWQEDIDFTRRVAENGKIIATSELVGVHLGYKGGRVSGVCFGYSQMVNPVYLVRKGTMPPLFALGLVGRNLVANVVKSVWPEPYVDRRGRLKGNLLGLYQLLRGRVDPEYILKL